MPASRPHPSPAVSRASSSEMPNVQQINAASGGMPASRPYASPAVSRMSSSEMPNVEPLASKQVQARAQTPTAAEEPDTAKARMRAHLQTVARMSVSYARQRLRKMSHTTNDSVVASLKQDVVLSIGGTLGLRWKRCHGVGPPIHGTERSNEKLSTALVQYPPQLEFTRQEFASFDLYDLKGSHYIRAGEAWFQPDIGTPLRSLVDNRQHASTVRVAFDPTGQHTVEWLDTIVLVDSTTNALQPGSAVPPGGCNLYDFPRFEHRGTGTSSVLTGPQVETIAQLLITLAESDDFDWCGTADASGAYPTLALLVGNTDASLSVAWKLLQHRPRLLMQVHTKTSDGRDLYLGESCLHILCVNEREDLLCDVLALGQRALELDDFSDVVRAQAVGSFFEKPPMCFYGGTPLSYACCFRLERAVVRLLETGLVSLNDRRDACKITGFLPVHAVVANGLTGMYEWLTSLNGALPAARGAAEDAPHSAVGGRVRDAANILVRTSVRGGGGAASGGDHPIVMGSSMIGAADVRIVEHAGDGGGGEDHDVGDDVGDDGNGVSASGGSGGGGGGAHTTARRRWRARAAVGFQPRAADTSLKTAVRSRLGVLLRLHSLNPLQLACQLGDHATFKHVLRKQSKVLWKWGPVRQYVISLSSIDSAGRGGSDVMELVAKVGAGRRTTEMLLDSCMQGFLHKLFQEKWRRFGRPLHYARSALDGLILIVLLSLSFGVKERPRDYGGAVSAPVFLILFMMAVTAGEAFVAYLYYANERVVLLDEAKSNEMEARMSTRALVLQTLRWCQLHGVEWEFVSYMLIFVACCVVLSGAPAQSVANAILAGEEAANASKAAAAAAAAAANPAVNASNASNLTSAAVTLAAATVSGPQFVTCIDPFAPNLGEFGSSADAEPLNALWMLLSVGLLVKTLVAIRALVIPFEATNVFVLSVSRILRNDMVSFLLFFGAFILLLFACMYIVYPRSGGFDDLNLFSEFNSWYEALHAVIVLALTGTTMPLAPNSGEILDGLSGWQSFDLFLFGCFYIAYILLSITLLLNLLVAMLTSTFDGVKQESTLHSRLSFAQCVLRWELLAKALGRPTAVGKRNETGDRVFEFRAVERNVEGGSTYGSDDPFDEDHESAEGVSRRQLAEQGETLRALTAKVETLCAAMVKVAIRPSTATANAPAGAALVHDGIGGQGDVFSTKANADGIARIEAQLIELSRHFVAPSTSPTAPMPPNAPRADHTENAKSSPAAAETSASVRQVDGSAMEHASQHVLPRPASGKSVKLAAAESDAESAAPPSAAELIAVAEANAKVEKERVTGSSSTEVRSTVRDDAIQQSSALPLLPPPQPLPAPVQHVTEQVPQETTMDEAPKLVKADTHRYRPSYTTPSNTAASEDGDQKTSPSDANEPKSAARPPSAAELIAAAEAKAKADKEKAASGAQVRSKLRDGASQPSQARLSVLPPAPPGPGPTSPFAQRRAPTRDEEAHLKRVEAAAKDQDEWEPPPLALTPAPNATTTMPARSTTTPTPAPMPAPESMTPSASLNTLSNSPSRSWLEAAATRDRRSEATKTLQAKWQAVRAEQKRAEQKQDGAIRIQAAARARAATKETEQLRSKRKAAQKQAELEQSSAVRVQSVARARSARQQTEQRRQLFKEAAAKVRAEEAAVRIQSIARARAAAEQTELRRQLFKEAEAKVLAEEANAVQKLQARTRGLLSRKKLVVGS